MKYQDEDSNVCAQAKPTYFPQDKAAKDITSSSVLANNHKRKMNAKSVETERIDAERVTNAWKWRDFSKRWRVIESITARDYEARTE